VLNCAPKDQNTNASLSGGFTKTFIILNIINFVDVLRREKDEVSWDVRRISSP
jgi:hypothetical protein